MAKQVLSRGPEQAGWLTALASAPRSNNAPPFWSWLAERVEPGASCPQASPEVEVARFPGQRRGETYVLKQPRAGSYLRLTPEEHFIWQRLDGRPVRQILADYFDQYGCFAPGLVLDLINRLRQAQMLTEPPRPLYAGLADRLRRRGWGWRAEQLLRGLLLYERTVPGFNRAATLLYQAGGWLLFTRPAPFLLAALVLLGLGVYLSLVQRGGFEVVTTGGSFALGFLVFTAANALASLVVELGRALATVHHGCEVRAGGLRVLLAMPSFYLDTRDIWMEDRRARMRVAVAGSGALLTSASLAALVLALTPAGPFTDFLFKFALLCYGTTLFYLNPLVKLDGYTLLSEWLEEPDLQERSLVFLRSGLFRKLRTGQRLHRREQAQAGFGALVVVWTLYTALGGLYFVAWRALAGLDELWRHDQPQMRFIGIAGTIALGSGLALGGALLLLRLLTQSYRWAERRGLLTDAPRLAIGAVGVALPLGLAAALLPVPPDVYRGLVAPPLLMVALISASRLAREYDGARLRWFFVALAGYAVLVFVKEELDALRVLVQLDPTWTLWVDRSVSLLGPLLCLPFGFWLASLVTSRYRAPIALLGGGIGLYGLQALLPPGPVAAVLATTGVGLLTAGLLIYQILHRRWRTVRTLDALPLADDASRLADSMRTLVAQLLDDLVAQSGRRAVDQLQARFNLAAEQAGWDLSLRELRLEEVERRDLLSAAPVYRQALVLLLEEAAARSGRPFVERALGRAWDAIPWDRREVVDAWVLGKLAWGGVGMNRAVGKQVDRLRFLRRVPIFAGLDEVELRQIAEAFEERRARVGARIIRQGEPGDTYYLIRSGVVEVLKRNGNQAEAVVARLGEGDGFGELALLYEQPRSASIRALTPVELLALRRADFDRLLRERFSLLDKLGPTLERERLLAAIPLFGGLSPRELSMLTRSLAETTVEPGQVVVRQGAAGDSFYLVVTGRLAVTVEDPTGAARTVAHLGPGEYFGEMALLHDRPRSATVSAELPSRLLVLHKAEFDRLLWRQNSANRDLQLVASRRRLDLAAKLGAQ